MPLEYAGSVQGRGKHRIAVFAAAVAAILAVAVSAAFGAVSVGHSGWFWGSPKPQGNTLSGLDFVGDRGYASGDFGTLLRTDDAGASWTGVATGIIDPLVRVRVINADSVVIGGGCALRRSDDGGQSFRRLPWTPSDRSCPSPLASFSFPTPDIGYLLTANGSVIRTADGGESFSRRTSVPGTSSTGGSASGIDIFFTSADVGVVVAGGRIFRTTDAANSWTEVYPGGPELNGIAFADANVGYVVGAETTMLRTDDGGTTWAPVALQGASPGLNLTSLDCSDPQTCLIAESSGARILRTADGGATANAISPSTEPILAVAFASASRAIAVGAQGATVVSDNGGVNFSPIGGAIAGQQFGPVSASSSEIASAGAANGILARTVDGGQTWSTVGVPTAAAIANGSFLTPEIGYALDTAGGAFKTLNSGATWILLSTGTISPPARILALDPNQVLVVGPRGIRRSTDGGTSFVPVLDADVRRATLFDAGSISGDDVFAVGTEKLAVSGDGGAHWSNIPLPGRRTTIFDADFVSLSAGFVITASDHRIFATSNRGRTWRELPAVGTRSTSGITFSSPSNGYVSATDVGRSRQQPRGFVLRTTNGGQTWQPQLVDRSAIAASDAGPVAFANNSEGSFFATTTGGQAGTPSALTIRKQGRFGNSKVRIAGTLSPPEGGESIVVSTRTVKKADWRSKVLSAASDGKFTTSVSVSKPTYVVAQWIGDDDRAGAGSRALLVKPPS